MRTTKKNKKGRPGFCKEAQPEAHGDTGSFSIYLKSPSAQRDALQSSGPAAVSWATCEGCCGCKGVTRRRFGGEVEEAKRRKREWRAALGVSTRSSDTWGRWVLPQAFSFLLWTGGRDTGGQGEKENRVKKKKKGSDLGASSTSSSSTALA